MQSFRSCYYTICLLCYLFVLPQELSFSLYLHSGMRPAFISTSRIQSIDTFDLCCFRPAVNAVVMSLNLCGVVEPVCCVRCVYNGGWSSKLRHAAGLSIRKHYRTLTLDVIVVVWHSRCC